MTKRFITIAYQTKIHTRACTSVTSCPGVTRLTGTNVGSGSFPTAAEHTGTVITVLVCKTSMG